MIVLILILIGGGFLLSAVPSIAGHSLDRRQSLTRSFIGIGVLALALLYLLVFGLF